MTIEIVEPAAQLHGSISRGISGNKNEFDLISNTGGQVLKGRANIRHARGTLIRAIGIAEKEKRDRPPGSVPKIKWNTGGVRENKFRFRNWGRDHAAPVWCFSVIDMSRVASRLLPRHDRDIAAQ